MSCISALMASATQAVSIQPSTLHIVELLHSFVAPFLWLRVRLAKLVALHTGLGLAGQRGLLINTVAAADAEAVDVEAAVGVEDCETEGETEEAAVDVEAAVGVEDRETGDDCETGADRETVDPPRSSSLGGSP